MVPILAAVSKLMGHSTVKMTADVYYHYLEGEKERAVELLPVLEMARMRNKYLSGSLSLLSNI